MKNIPTSYEIAPYLFLIQQPIAAKAPAKPVEQPTNHIIVIDCSGSMMGELPQIRAHLKAKLPKLLKEDDTVSILWFSGRGEFGTLVTAERVAGLKDLQALNACIDRWLRPVGLTGFKEPLVEVAKLVTRTKNGNPWSLFFMSDGCDNQWDRAAILKAVEQAAEGLSAATFVEYGYYADRALLAAMAEKAGGTHIFAESFPKFEPVIDAALQKRAVGGKRIEVKVGGDPLGGFAFMLHGTDELHTFETTGGKITVPEDAACVWYLSSSAVGQLEIYGDRRSGSAISQDALYAALSLYAVRMKPDIVHAILKATGDVRFIKLFAACFGKQRYSEFMQEAQRAAFDATKRCLQGYNPNLVPPDDAFTVLDLLNLLSEDDDARVLLDHPAFEYNRIGRATLDADEFLSSDEQAQLDALQEELKVTKAAKKLKEINAQIATLLAKKRDALKFVADSAPTGYEISALTFNEEKPNVSILVKKTGIVDLAARIGETKDGQLASIPLRFPTHIWRNYAIVKDGLVNVGKLPVTITDPTRAKLIKAGVALTPISGLTGAGKASFVVDLTPLPILNRKQVNAAVSAQKLIELEYALTTARAAQKVYNAIQAEVAPPERSTSMAARYGEYAATWLKEQGFTDGGFSPKRVQAESLDFYVARELEVKLKGLASMPSVKDVRAKLGKNVPNTGGAGLMARYIIEVDTFMKANPAKLHKEYIQSLAKLQRAITRGLIYQKAQILFGVIVGQVWFHEFKSLDDNTLTITTPQGPITGTITMKEVEVKI